MGVDWMGWPEELAGEALPDGGALALLRVYAWLSPVFPTGGFAYSGGLECAIAEGQVAGESGLGSWLSAIIWRGGLRNDAILLGRAWALAHDGEELRRLCELALALAPGAERHGESLAIGRSVLDAVQAWPQLAPIAGHALPEPAFPIVYGAACRLGGIGRHVAVPLFMQAWASSQLQAAIRLSVTGQAGAARLLAALERQIDAAAAEFAGRDLDDLGSLSINADIACLRHEMLEVRLFRS